MDRCKLGQLANNSELHMFPCINLTTPHHPVTTGTQTRHGTDGHTNVPEFQAISRAHVAQSQHPLHGTMPHIPITMPQHIHLKLVVQVVMQELRCVPDKARIHLKLNSMIGYGSQLPRYIIQQRIVHCHLKQHHRHPRCRCKACHTPRIHHQNNYCHLTRNAIADT